MEIRRSYDRLISTMGFHILVRQHLYIKSYQNISRPWCKDSTGVPSIWWWLIAVLRVKVPLDVSYTGLLMIGTLARGSTHTYISAIHLWPYENCNLIGCNQAKHKSRFCNVKIQWNCTQRYRHFSYTLVAISKHNFITCNQAKQTTNFCNVKIWWCMNFMYEM